MVKCVKNFEIILIHTLITKKIKERRIKEINELLLIKLNQNIFVNIAKS